MMAPIPDQPPAGLGRVPCVPRQLAWRSQQHGAPNSLSPITASPASSRPSAPWPATRGNHHWLSGPEPVARCVQPDGAWAPTAQPSAD